MSAIFSTYPQPILKPVRAKGSWLWDENNNGYLDFTSGIGVCQLGHGPDEVKTQIINQLDRVWHTSNLFEIEPQMRLAEELVNISGLQAVFFANSGAEANEAAIKLARRYHQKVKNRDRYQVITFIQSFHGRTLATLTATGQDKVKEGFTPLPDGFISVPYGDIEALKGAINEHTAAIMLEIIQGEGGINLASDAWLKEVERLAKADDILLIIDEVQTGIGRTGKWFGFQHHSVEPDIITLAKGLGSGLPIGAMIGSEKTKEAFTLGSHGSTFGGNFLSTTAGLATIETIKKEYVLENVLQREIQLFDLLREKLAVYPEMVEVRGKGLMVGVEWSLPVAELIRIAKNHGLLVLSAGPNVLRLLPPLNISKEEVDLGITRLLISVKEWLGR